MALVPAILTNTKAPRLALGLPTVILVLAAAFACGGDEEIGDPPATTNTPAFTQPPTAPATASNCPPPSAETPPPVQAKSYEQRPALTIDTSHEFIAHVYTTRGHFIVELLPEHRARARQQLRLPGTGEVLQRDGVFHRVVPGFVVQGGDPTGTGTGGAGYTVPLEPSEEPFVRGVVGMARSQDPNSAGSQWFFTLGDAPHLNGQYTVFGKVVRAWRSSIASNVGDADHQSRHPGALGAGVRTEHAPHSTQTGGPRMKSYDKASRTHDRLSAQVHRKCPHESRRFRDRAASRHRP